MTLLFSDRAGVGDAAGQCAGGSGSGRSQIHLALDVAHAAHEVAVGGGDAALTLGEDGSVCGKGELGDSGTSVPAFYICIYEPE